MNITQALTATVLLLALPTTAIAKDATKLPKREHQLPRISAVDARYAAEEIFEMPAAALGDKLVISPCKPIKRRSRVCVARVGPDRYRVVSRYDGIDKSITAAATRLPQLSTSPGLRAR